MADINEIIYEIQKRRNGNLFSGADPDWCKSDFGGCSKFQNCDLVEQKIKIKVYNKAKKTEDFEFTDNEKKALSNINCYLLTNPNRFNQPNPFGVRSETFETDKKKYQKSDLNPCIYGGCVTPLMIQNEKPIDCCPYRFRAKDENSFKLDSDFVKNEMQFAQCYLTLKPFREFLENNGVIVAAPLFRESDTTKNGYWYPFFGGYSFVQIPSSLKQREPIPSEMRWLATTIQRNNNGKTNKIFDWIEISKSDNNIAEYYKNNCFKNRYIDVSDGWASWFLLSWIIERRKTKKLNPTWDKNERVKWEYSNEPLNIILKLKNIKFEDEINKLFEINGDIVYRIGEDENKEGATLDEDLKLLGLISDNNEHNRFSKMIEWINSLSEDHIIYEKIHPLKNDNDIYSLIKKMNEIEYNNTFPLTDYCPLTPEVHIIVRYGMPPMNWILVPLQNSLVDNHSKVMSGIIVLLNESLATNTNETIKKVLPVLNLIASIEEQNARNEISIKQQKLEKEKEEQSIKSAIAAIMSRNMSHNLGSHVFFYTRKELLGIIEKMEENGIGNNYSNLDKGLAWFLQYVQERQDFIANINSQDSYVFGPLNLKQDVFDIINPDSLDERHRKSHNSIITRNFLLENIVKSEKVSRNSKENLKDIKLIIDFNNNKLKSDENGDNINNFYDIDLAVSGGQQSRHAFLIILENIIRNSAKHGFDYSKHNNLSITIKVSEIHKLYNIQIFDNCENAFENLPNNNIVIEELQKSLKELKLIKDHIIDRSGKGLKEILVCILWLQNKHLSDIEIFAKQDINKNIIEVNKINENTSIEQLLSLEIFAVDSDGNKVYNDKKQENKGSICYQFCLPKFEKEIDLNKNYNIKNSFGYIYYNKNEFVDHPERTFPLYLETKNNINIWQQIFEKNYNTFSNDKEIQDYVLKFDKGIKLMICKEECYDSFDNSRNGKIIFFKDHFAKNEKTLEANLKNNSENEIIEHCSGANQTYILLQRFIDLQTKKLNNNLSESEKEKNISDIKDLYYRVVNAYTTKVVIIDERLSFPYTKNYFKDVESFTTEDFVKAIFNFFDYDHVEKINKLERNKDEIFKYLTNNISSLNTNCVLNTPNEDISQLNTEYIDKKDCYKEKFYEQQKTFLYDMNEVGKLTNSTGIISPEVALSSDVKFLSIHIGLIDKYKITIPTSKGFSKKEMSSTTSKLKHLLTTTFKLNESQINKMFICVHSGRGGLNSEADNITFIPFSNLQRCFEDSKYELVEFLNSIKFKPLKLK